MLAAMQNYYQNLGNSSMLMGSVGAPKSSTPSAPLSSQSSSPVVTSASAFLNGIAANLVAAAKQRSTPTKSIINDELPAPKAVFNSPSLSQPSTPQQQPLTLPITLATSVSSLRVDGVTSSPGGVFRHSPATIFATNGLVSSTLISPQSSFSIGPTSSKVPRLSLVTPTRRACSAVNVLASPVVSSLTPRSSLADGTDNGTGSTSMEKKALIVVNENDLAEPAGKIKHESINNNFVQFQHVEMAKPVRTVADFAKKFSQIGQISSSIYEGAILKNVISVN